VSQHVVQFGIESSQCASDTEFASTGLAGRAAAVDFDPDVYRRELASLVEGIEDLKAVFDGREIVVNRSLVNQDFAATGFDTDASDRSFAATGGKSVAGGVRFGGRSWSSGGRHF
jgi:hypothetical protein